MYVIVHGNYIKFVDRTDYHNFDREGNDYFVAFAWKRTILGCITMSMNFLHPTIKLLIPKKEKK